MRRRPRARGKREREREEEREISVKVAVELAPGPPHPSEVGGSAAVYRSSVPASSTPLRPGRTCNTQESLGAAGVAARGVEDWRRVATIDRPMKQNQEWNIEGMNGNTPIRDPTSSLSGLILSSLLCIFVEEGLRQESHSLAITEDQRGSDRRHVEKGLLPVTEVAEKKEGAAEALPGERGT
ncbi:hypothetical protein D4764_01G0017740 [Takifugu flavidus]|uniref:Uncharacterized protein n=1 Tax=Takifugu flavidus TaxID=433684 RepID=A0A5C6PSV5_9TELE|nr:hypothetical protein D4764_01G0017740 [Takifugu flavidus]